MTSQNVSMQTIYDYPFIPNNDVEPKKPWDPNRPFQNWARPLEPGDDANDMITLYTWVPESVQSTNAVRVPFTMSKGDAATSNLISSDDPANQGGPGADRSLPYWSEPPVPIPMRELKPNERLKATPFGLTLTVYTRD